MYDLSTGWQIGVDGADTVGAYIIIVSRRQMAALSGLLARHQVPHVIEAFVPDQLEVEDPVKAVFRLDACVEDLRGQEILDRAP